LLVLVLLFIISLLIRCQAPCIATIAWWLTAGDSGKIWRLACVERGKALEDNSKSSCARMHSYSKPTSLRALL
jgi:hypothetical protein